MFAQAYKAHEFVSKATLHVTSAKASFVHFGITSVLLAIGFVVANIIPFFADMQVSPKQEKKPLFPLFSCG